jgi:hypothetical protein
MYQGIPLAEVRFCMGKLAQSAVERNMLVLGIEMIFHFSFCQNSHATWALEDDWP